MDIKQHPNLGQQFTLLGIPVVVRQDKEDPDSVCDKCAFAPRGCLTCDVCHETLPSCTQFEGTYYEAVQDVDSN